MSAVRALREALGDTGMAGLEEVVNDAGMRWKDDVLGIAAERFERRLSQEIGALRVDMAKEFASVRTDMANEFAAVRTEMARMQTELMKWSFLFWVGQVAAMTAITALLLRTIR